MGYFFAQPEEGFEVVGVSFYEGELPRFRQARTPAEYGRSGCISPTFECPFREVSREEAEAYKGYLSEERERQARRAELRRAELQECLEMFPRR